MSGGQTSVIHRVNELLFTDTCALVPGLLQPTTGDPLLLLAHAQQLTFGRRRSRRLQVACQERRQLVIREVADGLRDIELHRIHDPAVKEANGEQVEHRYAGSKLESTRMGEYDVYLCT